MVIARTRIVLIWIGLLVATWFMLRYSGGTAVEGPYEGF